MNSTNPTLATAILGGGCFWCLEAVFEQLKGVHKVVSGYINGAVPNPTYRAVCSGDTGHAEVIQVTYDPAVISFDDLLNVFFVIHDPTTLNRQGADEGTQYRSGIFYQTPEEQQAANAKIAELNAAGVWSSPIVTEVTPAATFYPAEEYHQGYFRTNPNQQYCQYVVAPKVAKLRKYFLDKLKT
jgi:peptide-methionine (S)-S-oxide reductase